MEKEQASYDMHTEGVRKAFEQLRQFSGPPDEFWPAFLEVCARLCGATLGALLVQGEEEGIWRKLSLWPSGSRSALKKGGLESRLEEIADASLLKACDQPLTRPERGHTRLFP